MKKQKITLDRFDSFEMVIDGVKYQLQKRVGEYHASVSKVKEDGITTEFYNSKTFDTFEGAAKYLRRKFSKIKNETL